MRRASYDNRNSSSSTRKNIGVADASNRGLQSKSSVTTTSTTSTSSKDVDYRRAVNYNSQTHNQLQRSASADNNVVIRSRGFKPSDIRDPAKRNFLQHLTSKILHFEMDSGEATPINLQKLLTPPAMETTEYLQTKNKKMYASSCFYAPTHPTVEDQVELARRISYSLSDVKNMKSKGQSMYVNRKKRSVKWIHDGNGVDGDEEPASPIHKDKIPLKCMMNPNGKVMDLHGIQALGEEVNMGTSPSNAGKLFDIVRDLNNQKGRGAEIFAKRRKRSEKWVVDKEQWQNPSTISGLTKSSPSFPTKPDENAKFTSLPPLTPLEPMSSTPAPFVDTKPFYNPFTLDLSLESVTPLRTGNDERRGSQQSDNSTSKYTEVKKVYLREVAVGTEPEYPMNGDRGLSVEKSKRMNMYFDASSNNGNNYDRRLVSNGAVNNNRRTKSSSSNTNGSMSNGKSRESNNHANQEPPTNGYRRTHAHPNSYHHHHHRRQQQQQQQQAVDDHQMLADDNEYTPVPVKQLIQEFEKTCRPVMQYKQISPRIIPIVQQCPSLDNDLSRFFESSRMSNNEPSQHQRQQVARPTGGNSKIMINGNTGAQRYSNGNANDAPARVNYTGVQQMPNHLIRQIDRYEEYDSSEEDEIDDSFGDTESESNYCQGNGHLRMYEEDDESRSTGYNGINENETRATSNCTMDEYEMYVRQFDESTRLFEAPPGFRNGDSENNYSRSDGNVSADTAKSMAVLAMVASQDDILDTIKHLRNTPVLENLIGAPSPDFYATPDADVGDNNKLGENGYQGPKIASFQSLTNYNTAPRGWDQTKPVYRPVTFGKQQEPIAYSDF